MWRGKAPPASVAFAVCAAFRGGADSTVTYRVGLISTCRSHMSMSFADLGVPSNLVERLAARGITEAFPIQEAALPDALAGRDVVGKAVTGSGKTLAFGLPLMARLTKARPRKPHGLVLVPTRELAAQVQKELANLTDDRGRRSGWPVPFAPGQRAHGWEPGRGRGACADGPWSSAPSAAGRKRGSCPSR